jgi:hypothetical protein
LRMSDIKEICSDCLMIETANTCGSRISAQRVSRELEETL